MKVNFNRAALSDALGLLTSVVPSRTPKPVLRCVKIVATKNDVLKPKEWIHVFATYDGSGTIGGIKIYINGAEQPLNTANNTLKPEASIRTSTPLRVGQRSESQVFENGAIQEVRVYSRLLSAVEVKA
ncbi:MAG TPA: hypothetical protein PKJ56_03750, partial [Promineifilum sp.]|nr:hypothetical protein [Promineifilum sp.]